MASAASHGHGRIRPAPSARLLPVAGEGERPARDALAGGRRQRNTDRSASRPDALHRRCDLGPGLRRRRQHARVGRRRHPEPSRQDFPRAVQAAVRAALAAPLVEERGRSPARPQRRRGQCRHRRLRGGGAASTRRRPGAPDRTAQPARGDDRRRRRSRLRHHRRRGLRQRHDHAAGRRGHDGQHAGLVHLAAAHPIPVAWQGRAPRSTRKPAILRPGRRNAFRRCPISKPAPTRRCGSSRSRPS